MAWLVADFGGTHARLALAERDGSLREPRRYACADHASLEALIATYLAAVGARPGAACLALAGPVTGDVFRFTNIDWTFSRGALAQTFGFAPLVLLNDFEALALALPTLAPRELRTLGPACQGAAGAPRAVLGPGTGLGVATLLPAGERWLALAGEGGHASFAPQDELEREIAARLARRGLRVSNETLLSGAGLTALDSVLGEIAGAPATGRNAAAVVSAALAGTDPRAAQVLDIFCAVLGAVAGDLALVCGARGGVYIGGGIAPRFAEILAASRFRARFEDKAPQQAWLAAIPTWLIVAEAPALAGAAAALRATENVL